MSLSRRCPHWLRPVLLLAVAALVLLLYLLKPSPRRLVVPSMLIWRRVLRDAQAHAGPPALVAVAAARFADRAVAHAGADAPELAVFGGSAQRVVLVLDDSGDAGRHRLRRQDALAARAGAGARARAGRRLQARYHGRRYAAADCLAALREREAALSTLARLHVVAGGKPQFPDVLRSGERDVRAVLITDGVAAIDAAAWRRDAVGVSGRRQRGHHRLRRAARCRATRAAFRPSSRFSMPRPARKQVELQVAGAGASAAHARCYSSPAARARAKCSTCPGSRRAAARIGGCSLRRAAAGRCRVLVSAAEQADPRGAGERRATRRSSARCGCCRACS